MTGRSFFHLNRPSIRLTVLVRSRHETFDHHYRTALRRMVEKFRTIDRILDG